MLSTVNNAKRAIRCAHKAVSKYLNKVAAEFPSIELLVGHLEKQGIKGTPSCSKLCPLTCLVYRFLDNETNVFGISVLMMPAHCMLKLVDRKHCHVAKIPLPDIFPYFIELYDQGRYKQLMHC